MAVVKNNWVQRRLENRVNFVCILVMIFCCVLETLFFFFWETIENALLKEKINTKQWCTKWHANKEMVGQKYELRWQWKRITNTLEKKIFSQDVEKEVKQRKEILFCENQRSEGGTCGPPRG